MMEFYNLDKSTGIEIFSYPHNHKKLKSEDQSLDGYKGWLDSFSYIHNETMTVALKPCVDGVEFHFVTTPNSTVKDKIKALQLLSDIFKGVPMTTSIGMNNKKLMDFCCKRFGFKKEKWCGFVVADGEKHRKFKLTREAING